MAQYVMALDQGTTSTRAIIFDNNGQEIASAQREHAQIFPQAGWLEHDPNEIWTNAEWAISTALRRGGLSPKEVAALGITNQRETVIIWDRYTGQPLHNAIVWQDTRTDDKIAELADEHGLHAFAELTGLPLASYFSASKIAWLLAEVPGLRAKAESGAALFGTPDSWLLWNLTGGRDGGIHATDVTNASRTMLMDIQTLQWSKQLLELWNIPVAMLPEIRPSVEMFGETALPRLAAGIPIAGILGDQQAAAFGQAAFNAGDSKNTYGTGNFLLINTGTELHQSRSGLISTVAYQIAGEKAHYAIEGSIAVTGSLVQWLRDNLGIIERSEDIETLAETVPDTGGAYLVPAFSGLYAPYWRPDARGVLVGLTRYVNRAHIARAALEATAFQTRDVIDAASGDTGYRIERLRVDGGMTRNDLLMQFQADILAIPVVRPRVIETTALGAAFAAGLGVGVWSSTEEIAALWQEEHRYEPRMPEAERSEKYRLWQKALTRSFGWAQ